MKKLLAKINSTAAKVVFKKFGLALGIGLGIGLTTIGLIKLAGPMAAIIILLGSAIGLNLFVSYLDEVEKIEHQEMMDVWLEEVSMEPEDCEDCECNDKKDEMDPPVH